MVYFDISNFENKSHRIECFKYQSSTISDFKELEKLSFGFTIYLVWLNIIY